MNNRVSNDLLYGNICIRDTRYNINTDYYRLAFDIELLQILLFIYLYHIDIQIKFYSILLLSHM